MSPVAQRELARRHLSGSFLDALAAPDASPFDCSDVLVIVAHPDDETIGLGGQLARLEGVRILHVTDGAPAAMEDARANGFSTREEYSTARRRELEAAMRQAGLGPEALLSLGVPDQTTAFRMSFLARRLSTVFQEHGTATVVTHAYEGGHSDHDATAFIVHAARHMLSREGVAAPRVVEFPLYHLRRGRTVVQEFAAMPDAAPPEVALELTAADLALKRRMLAAHRTQRQTLAPFSSPVERFRLAPRYDFSQLPNAGELHYERFPWGLTGETWQMLVEEAGRELGFPQWL